MTINSLLHYVSLDGAGGVELQFVEFLAAAQQRQAGLHQAVVACGEQVHPLVGGRLTNAGVPVAYEKYASVIKLPKWPAALRTGRQRSIVRRHQPDAVLIWNRLRDSLNTLAAAGPERCIYWERGASWFADETRAKRQFLSEIQFVLCNSFAARRMLELRWGYEGRVAVIHNALRPSLAPLSPVARTLPTDRPLRLGVAARLVPIKGVALAIHALADLVRRGLDVELVIAGDGPERERLVKLTLQLSLTKHVRFAGLVTDMHSFYSTIDLLVHPALREPFGQIAVEAAAHGVPAIVAGVDGLVEVVVDGHTGYAISPNLALSDYQSLGGSFQDLPPFVYQPASDTLGKPQLLDPAKLADAVERLGSDASRYAAFSAAALKDVATRFGFDRHVDTVLVQINDFIR